MDRATELLQNKDYKNAASILENIINSNPVNSDALHSAGICYSKMGKLSLAKEKFKLATEHSPNNVEFLQNYSYTLYKLGEITASINTLELANKKADEDALISHQLAFLHFSQKNLAKSLQHAQNAITMISKKDDYYQTLELLELKALIYEKTNKNKAIDTYFKIINMCENYPNAYDRISSLLIDKYNFSTNIYKLNSKTKIYQKATLDLRAGDTNNAIVKYKKAIKKDRFCYPAYLGISQSLYEEKFGIKEIQEGEELKEIKSLIPNYNELNAEEKKIISSSLLLHQKFITNLIKENKKLIIVPIDSKITDYSTNLHLKNLNYLEEISFCSLRGLGGTNAFIGVEKLRDLLWNVNNAEKFIPASVAHEFAHMVWCLLPDKTINKIKKLFKKAQEENYFISNYSSSNVQEYFAEYYALCTRIISTNEKPNQNDSMVELILDLAKS